MFGFLQDKDDDLEISLKERCDWCYFWLIICYIEVKVIVCIGMLFVMWVEEMDVIYMENIDQEMLDNMYDVLR